MRTRFADTAQHEDAFFVIRAISTLEQEKCGNFENQLYRSKSAQLLDVICVAHKNKLVLDWRKNPAQYTGI